MKNMPVDKKHLIGVIIEQHAYTTEQKTCAFEAGAHAFREGKQLADCPAEFLPQMGDSLLYDQWIAGFRAAAISDGGGGCD